MITGEIKYKVNKMWDYFWTGGLTNPVDVIEQLTYLMFMKKLDLEQMSKEKAQNDLGDIFCGASEDTSKYIYQPSENHLRWSSIKELGDGKVAFARMRDEAFDFIKNLDNKVEIDDEGKTVLDEKGEKKYINSDSAFSKYMKNAIFKVPTPAVLQNTMDVMEEIFTDPTFVSDRDAKGDLYEYLLSKLSTSGKNGQFRTPKHIINMMVELMKPTPEDTIIDPACGTAGFLASSVEYLMKHHSLEIRADRAKAGKLEHFNKEAFTGNDTDSTMLGISAMNLMLHNVEQPKLERENSLSSDYNVENKYSLVLANPPFKGSLDYDQVNTTLLEGAKTKKTELLFLRLITRIMKLGGRAAVIIPDGVLFGSSKAHKAVRQEIIEGHKLEAVISMPSGVFKPYAGVSTGILIYTKTNSGGTDSVWFYDMTADGFSLDDKRNELGIKEEGKKTIQTLEENNIPDIVERFNNLKGEKDRKRTDKSFFVPLCEIKEKGFDLSLNRYKKTEYEEVNYAKPKEILGDIRALESKIMKGIEAVESMLEV